MSTPAALEAHRNGSVDANAITTGDDFSGAGLSTSGVSAVPYMAPRWAANHWPPAVATHEANFPDAEHYLGDICALDVERRPRVDFYWASPACPPWTDARGKKRDFDKQTTQQSSLFADDEPETDEQAKKARALMEEVPRYLRAMSERGRPVLAGVVENVIQCRLWSEWDRWISELHLLGYKTRVIAFNSMHAVAHRSLRAPQSRDRLYVAYWHRSLGRDPNWDKWLRPEAWCERCGEVVRAVQVFKKPGADMGRYRAQYVYACDKTTCRGAVVEPPTLPALVAIDPTIPGIAIKDRPANGPLAPATIDRIKAGIRRHWLPLLTPCGGTWRTSATRLDEPAPTRTTTESDGIAVPPLLVPVEGRRGKNTTLATGPHRTQTARNETALATLPLPFVTPLRGGGDKLRTRCSSEPLHTVTASGNHHGVAFSPLVMRNFTARGDAGHLSTPASEPLRSITAQGNQSLLTWADQLLVPYYGSSESATPATNPFGALSTRDRYGLALPGAQDVEGWNIDDLIGDVMFRMLEPHEIARTMAAAADYRLVAKSKRTKVRLYGNGVTPPVSEILGYALMETITGETFEPASLVLAGVA